MSKPKTQLFHHPHEYGGANRIRVWRENWRDDVFEVLTQEEFTTLSKICIRFNISITDVEHLSEEEKQHLRSQV